MKKIILPFLLLLISFIIIFLYPYANDFLQTDSQPTVNTVSVNQQVSGKQVGSITYGSESMVWPLPMVTPFWGDVTIPLRIRDLNNSTENTNQAKRSIKKTVTVPVVVKELTDPRLLSVEYELYEQAITVVKNNTSLIPFQNLDKLTFASLTIGQNQKNYFQEYLSKYASFQHFSVSSNDTSARAYDALIEKLGQYKVVIISLHTLNNSALQSYGIPQSSRTFIERLRSKTKVALVVFGTPYSLKYFDRMDYLVCAYEDNSVTQKLVPQILFGAIPATGKLPVTVTATMKEGSGIPTPSLKRLAYTIPEKVGLSSATLQRIDRIVENCIQDSVMPGAQVLVAKNGKVVYEKAYGYVTYDKTTPVKTNTLYDLASVTKVAATLQAVMALHSNGALNINRKASDYLPELKNTNKKDILIQDLLLHQAGLLAFQDHWTKTRNSTSLDSLFYSPSPDERHSLLVAPGIYGIPALRDSLWHWTLQSRLLKKPRLQKHYTYKYSDVGFDILQQLVERLVNQPMDEYLNEHFYLPLGLDELTFNPLSKFKEDRIAPTELDNRFRGVLLQGTVHDQSAAMMGGVAGHAGLFGTANDLAALMQMNLQKGFYGGKQFLKESTIPTFTKTYHSNNRRGLGWDRPLPENLSEFVSKNSFGHTGFTGTCVWIDPDQEIVYIFLSNRVYPDVSNNKLARYKVREKIQHVVYESLASPEIFVADIKKK